VRDQEMFSGLVEAMGTIGISDDEQGYIWQLLAGLLSLGNLDFEEGADEESGASSQLAGLDGEEVGRAAAHLGFDVAAMGRTFTTRTVSVGGEDITTPLSAGEAKACVDGLATTSSTVSTPPPRASPGRSAGRARG